MNTAFSVLTGWRFPSSAKWQHKRICEGGAADVRRQYEKRRGAYPKMTKDSGQAPPNSTSSASTDDIFAIDAGRDLFFAAMDASTAIRLLDAELGSLPARDDRFIAAERLKFYPSEETTEALMRFVRKFEAKKMGEYILEDRVARRKCVESLGRLKGRYRREKVLQLLMECLSDEDEYMVEVAVWAMAEVGIGDNTCALEAIARVLDSDSGVCKRVLIQTLMRARYKKALPIIREYVESRDVATASAAAAACAVLTGDSSAMEPVIQVLRSANLNTRRAAIEDLTLAKYVPALRSVLVCPNSLVLRARTARVLLDERRNTDLLLAQSLDDETARLLDTLIWDNPVDLDLLGLSKETSKARAPDRNIRQLYKNDAVYAYLASRTLAEDFRSENEQVGQAILKSYNDLGYFDYFGAYHVYKTLGWLKYTPAYSFLLDKAASLPPRFFNHQAGAVTALAELGNPDAIQTFIKVARNSNIWQLKYACLISAERLGDDGQLRTILKNDPDWLVSARARSHLHFSHLSNSFPV